MSRRPHTHGLPRLFFRLALSAFPETFRRRHDEEMRAVFEEELARTRRRRGHLAASSYVVRATLDAIRQGLRERVRRSPPPGHGGRPPSARSPPERASSSAQSAVTGAVGAALGLAGAAAGSGLLDVFLWETPRLDPAAYTGAALLLLGVVLLASWLPARAVLRLDPAATLRSE